jgi:hypothetical protein
VWGGPGFRFPVEKETGGVGLVRSVRFGLRIEVDGESGLGRGDEVVVYRLLMIEVEVEVEVEIRGPWSVVRDPWSVSGGGGKS